MKTGSRIKEFRREDFSPSIESYFKKQDMLENAMMFMIEEVARLRRAQEGASAGMAAPLPGSEPLDQYVRATRPGLPDPRLIRDVLKRRRKRAKFFGEELFGDPAWDMILDLAAATAEGQRVSVTSLCVAAAVPATTALRWIGQMVDAGLLVRQEDSIDKRRTYIALSDKALNAVASYFAEIGLMSDRLL